MKQDIEKQMADIIRDYRNTQFDAIEESLTVVSEDTARKLEQASPIGKGPVHLKDQWGVKTKYKNVRYVGNSKMTKESKNFRSVPLSNVLEYGKRGKPFINRTWEINKNEVYNNFKKELERRIK